MFIHSMYLNFHIVPLRFHFFKRMFHFNFRTDTRTHAEINSQGQNPFFFITCLKLEIDSCHYYNII